MVVMKRVNVVAVVDVMTADGGCEERGRMWWRWLM